MTQESGNGHVSQIAAKLGLTSGDVIAEIGYDDDVDFDLREAMEHTIGAELLDEDADEVLDAVLLWWRDGDGDVTDALVDAATLLANDGCIWLLSPKTGRAGHVEPVEIAEAARTAGLSQTISVGGLEAWMINRLAPAKAARPKQR